MVDNKHNPATYFTNATTSDRASALLQHQTSHLPFPRHGKNGMWACSEYAGLFQGTHQCPHTRKKALGSCCSAGKMQEESGCTRDTWKHDRYLMMLLWWSNQQILLLSHIELLTETMNMLINFEIRHVLLHNIWITKAPDGWVNPRSLQDVWIKQAYYMQKGGQFSKKLDIKHLACISHINIRRAQRGTYHEAP